MAVKYTMLAAAKVIIEAYVDASHHPETLRIEADIHALANETHFSVEMIALLYLGVLADDFASFVGTTSPEAEKRLRSVINSRVVH